MASFYLKTTHNHVLHYQIIGNEDLPPVLLLHGGPGRGCTENDKRFFDTSLMQAILLDQRGCGKSRASSDINYNTTLDLIDDIIVLLDYLKIEKIVALGGSWGSALAMLFAMQYPERVKSLVLRGLFLASKESRKLYEDKTTKAYRLMMEKLPQNTGNAFQYIYNQLQNSDIDIQKKYTKIFEEFNLYQISEGNLTKLNPSIDLFSIINRSRIKLHYMINDFFIEDDYIINNLELLVDIPVRIIHGINDEICLPSIAQEICNRLNKGSIEWVEAGHLPTSPVMIDGVKKALLEAVQDLNRLF